MRSLKVTTLYSNDLNSQKGEKQYSLFTNPLRKRTGVEIILQDGTRRYYRPRATRHKALLSEVKTFIHCLQEETGSKVMWRFRGNDTFHMGTDRLRYASGQPIKEKFTKVVEYFFDLD